MAFPALLDTCVLYPTYLRDSLLRLADAGLYRPLWLVDILEELQRNLVAFGLGERDVRRMLANMANAFEGATLDGYQDLIPAMACHEKDRHVLAATVQARADTLVTFNLGDFPKDALSPYDVDALHPDEFLLDLLDLASGEVIQVLREQVARYRRQPTTVHGLLAALAGAGVPHFADEVRRRL